MESEARPLSVTRPVLIRRMVVIPIVVGPWATLGAWYLADPRYEVLAMVLCAVAVPLGGIVGTLTPVGAKERQIPLTMLVLLGASLGSLPLLFRNTNIGVAFCIAAVGWCGWISVASYRALGRLPK